MWVIYFFKILDLECYELMKSLIDIIEKFLILEYEV